MRSALDDPAVIENQDLVRAHDRRKPVRDHDAGAMRHQMLERLLDQPFGRRVDARRRFIQNQNRRILQERPRDREPLLFADAQFHSALAHHALRPFGKRSIKPRAFAASAAASNSSSVASGFPMSRFSRIVPLKRKLSCVTTPIDSRKALQIRSRESVCHRSGSRRR